MKSGCVSGTSGNLCVSVMDQLRNDICASYRLDLVCACGGCDARSLTHGAQKAEAVVESQRAGSPEQGL